MRRIGVALLGLGLMAAAGAVTLADAPLFSTVSVPGNLVLDLSVEWPTATTPAYSSTTAYASSSTYLGYFDPAKCYRYTYNSSTPANSYFAPYSAASSHTCSSSASVPLWSGNYLNWASMQTLDAFRWVLTGGYRSTDTAGTSSAAGTTILTKTNAAYDSTVMPVKSLADTTTISGATPFKWSALSTRLRNLGTRMWITGSKSNSNMTGNATTGATAYQAQSSYATKKADQADSTVTYEVYINVQVCSTAVSLESNCVGYSNGTSKPEGLMQQYASKLRYAAFGYLTDSSNTRDGGVLRAPMKYIGPTQPVPGSSSISNAVAEWNSTTGVMSTNPDPTLATSTTSASTSAGTTVSITQSGVMNYLNKFGYTANTYKSKDPVSELYYAAVRYLKNQGNVAAYSDLSGAGSSMGVWLDGFPVVQTWSDPILYSCQKNFVLGIGDDNTWYDANLPGNTLSGVEPSTPSEVSADATVNVKTATNMVGKLEGLTNLGSSFVSTSRDDTYYIAGLAYDSHTKDIRSDLTGTQTINTYWMDVLENQYYQYNNIYYLATKYGGFTVPSGFSPYASSNGTGTITTSAWHTNTDTLTDGSGGSNNGKTNSRPDNYFPGNRPDLMQTGLTAAFAKIASELSTATTTAFSSATRKVSTTGNASYAASYDPGSWTGSVTGSSISYSGSTVTTTAVWDAKTLLENPAYTDRKIVTCCDSSGAGLAFEDAVLSATSLNSRTLYSSFSSVPGVASASQSASNFVKYLRGDHTQEAANGGVYRTRTYRLGDIVDSKVTPVGAPSATYTDSTNAGYSTFKTTWAGRKTVVYVGANDGMMHAFDGSLSGSTMGTELFAYIPSFTYGDSASSSDRYYATYGLASLGNPSFTHHYFVNATPQSFDVDLAKTSGSTSSTPNWRTLLIGGLGKGGKGYYAIDVTDPSSWTSESVVAGKVLWEFTDSRMGYSYGEPLVAKTAKYGWVVMFSSGYNNSDGKGYLFIVNPRTGALLETIATSAGSTSSPINLSQLRGFVPDYTDYTVDAVYAGDLQGDVWRFDLTATSGSYPSPTLLAQLTNAAGTALPVTTKPLLGVDPTTKKRYVMVGTGQLLSDADVSSGALQGFFAIVDGTSTSGGFYTSSTLPAGVTLPVTRSKLTAVTDLTTGITGTAQVMGWYYDFSASGGIAERMNVDGDVTGSLVTFSANLPNGDVCNPAGTGRYFVVRFASGASVLYGANGTDIVSSITDTAGQITETVFQSVGGRVQVNIGDSAGNTSVGTISQDLPTLKRLNWRETSTVQ